MQELEAFAYLEQPLLSLPDKEGEHDTVQNM